MSNINFTEIAKLDEVDLRNIKVIIFQIGFLLYKEKKYFFQIFQLCITNSLYITNSFILIFQIY